MSKHSVRPAVPFFGNSSPVCLHCTPEQCNEASLALVWLEVQLEEGGAPQTLRWKWENTAKDTRPTPDTG